MENTKQPACLDFLAICLIGSGSSYGRAPTADKAVANCKKSLEQDWSSLFDLNGKEAKINVYDVTGYDELYWDDRGIHVSGQPEAKVERVELRSVTLSVKRRRR